MQWQADPLCETDSSYVPTYNLAGWSITAFKPGAKALGT